MRGKNVIRPRDVMHRVGGRKAHDQPTTRQEHTEPRKVGERTRILRNDAKVLPSEVGKLERRKHRAKEATNMLRVQNQLPVRGSHEEPRKEGPQGAQTSGSKGGKEQEFRKGHRDDLPDMQKKLYEPEDDAATHEDGAWGNPGVPNMQRVREKIPN